MADNKSHERQIQKWEKVAQATHKKQELPLVKAKHQAWFDMNNIPYIQLDEEIEA